MFCFNYPSCNFVRNGDMFNDLGCKFSIEYSKTSVLLIQLHPKKLLSSVIKTVFLKSKLTVKSLWKHQFPFDHQSFAVLSLVGTQMRDCFRTTSTVGSLLPSKISKELINHKKIKSINQIIIMVRTLVMNGLHIQCIVLENIPFSDHVIFDLKS